MIRYGFTENNDKPLADNINTAPSICQGGTKLKTPSMSTTEATREAAPAAAPTPSLVELQPAMKAQLDAYME